MVAESWFRNLWKIPRKHKASPLKEVIGVLAFEVSSLMSKLAHLWQSLSDKQIARLREEIINSVGIKKLVSEDEDFIANLIRLELIENLAHVAKSVARLGKKCNHPALKSFENAYEELIKIGADPFGWVFTLKKMEKKVKKMECFISINATLYQEMEMLSDHKQTLKRMKGNDSDPENLLEFQKKVAWKEQEVKILREASLWNKSYDYTVLLLARSLFTLFCRVKELFGVNSSVDDDSKDFTSDYMYHSHSLSALMQSSVHPSDNSGIARFSSGPLGMFTSNAGPNSKLKNMNNYHSGPLIAASTKSGLLSGKNNHVNFFSGPLGQSTVKSGPIFGKDVKSGKKMWKIRDISLGFNGKKPPTKTNRLTQVGPFKGCMIAADGSSANYYSSSGAVHLRIFNGAKDGIADRLPQENSVYTKFSVLNCTGRLLDAPPETLGAAALALHYANVIIVIEKLVASPHLIGHDAREDLYNMLPASVRAALRARLKPYTKSLATSVYDTVLVGEWTMAMVAILEWLAPVAHNMIRWQSERSFEQQNLISRTNTLLVQTSTLQIKKRQKQQSPSFLLALIMCGNSIEKSMQKLWRSVPAVEYLMNAWALKGKDDFQTLVIRYTNPICLKS